ncbi:MAG: ROK family protein [Amphiplicatus sp.]
MDVDAENQKQQAARPGVSVKTGKKRRLGRPGSFSGTNLELAGGHNQRVTLQAIRVNSPITRVDLAEMTGLTSPAIANITKRLLTAGLVNEVGRVRGGRGQPAKMLAINPDGCFSIGVNIDRDHITMVALDLLGQVRARAEREVDFALPDAVAKFFRKETERFFSKAGVPREKVIGVGVAAPDDLGKVELPLRPASYGAWNDIDVAALFSDILPLPVYVENDATAAAIGEMQFGYGLRRASFFYILVSWGLGGGLVLDGVYFRGASGRSGEIGFLPLKSGKDGGALQDVVSLSALYQHLSSSGFDLASPKHIDETEPGVRRALDEWTRLAAKKLEGPLVAINCLINPDAILIGGRLPGSVAEALARRLNAALARRTGDIPAVCPVEVAAIAEDAPAVGAAILPFSDLLFPTRAALLKTTV